MTAQSAAKRTGGATGVTGGRPVVPSTGALRPLGPAEARLAGGFWATRQEANTAATLEHCRTWLDKMGWIGNFAGAASGQPYVHRGPEFADSEAYKLLEAMSWEYGRTGSATVDADIQALTEVVAAAQADDGYIGTKFGHAGQGPRYSDLLWGHELYSMGHLIQAGVARSRTAGDDPLVRVARAAADHVCAEFGPDGRDGVCGHPEIEPALVELNRTTGDQRYLDQAKLFVERRGRRTLPVHRFGWSYFLDEMPVRRATILRGHAVRALYLTAGVVDVAVETGDTELLDIVREQFAQTLARRTYLTGGMGSRHQDESFGDDFSLPSDRSYVETCAGIAAIMVSWRLLLATAEPSYADLIERILYNVVAAAVGDDGRTFFYSNTLHRRTLTEESAVDHEALSLLGPRAPWYEVSCCPPNIARLLASLDGYLATATRTGVQLHQYADLDVATTLGDGRRVGFTVRTGYPETGTVVVTVTQTDGGSWGLSFRVPPWAAGATVSDARGPHPVTPGMSEIWRDFRVGDEVTLRLPVRPRWTFPDPRIDAVRDCVAVERGPVVLCAESTDQVADDLDSLRVDPSGELVDAPPGAVVAGLANVPRDDPWPYHDGDTAPEPGRPVPVSLVPYHRWARRGPSTMRIWLPRT